MQENTIVKYVSANTRLSSFPKDQKIIHNHCIDGVAKKVYNFIDESSISETINILYEYIAKENQSFARGLTSLENFAEFRRLAQKRSKYGGISEEALCYSPFMGLIHSVHISDGDDTIEKIFSSGYLLAPLDENNKMEFARTDQYPGVYMSFYGEKNENLIKKSNNTSVVYFIFPVTMLKFGGWHINEHEVYGDIGKYTCTAADIHEKFSSSYISNNAEIIFHYPIPLEYAEAILVDEAVLEKFQVLENEYRPKNSRIVSSIQSALKTNSGKHVKGLFLGPILKNNPSMIYPLIKKGKIFGLENENQMCFALNDERADTAYDAFRNFDSKFTIKPFSELLSIFKNCGYSKRKMNQIEALGDRHLVIEKIQKKMSSIYF